MLLSGKFGNNNNFTIAAEIVSHTIVSFKSIGIQSIVAPSGKLRAYRIACYARSDGLESRCSFYVYNHIITITE